MSGSFALCIYLAVMVFVNAGSWIKLGGLYADGARWVALAFLCLFALSRPRRLTENASGSPVRIFAFVFAALMIASSAWSSLRALYTFQRGLSVCLLLVFLSYALWPRLRQFSDYVSLTKVLVAVMWTVALLSFAFVAAGRTESMRFPTGAWQGVFGNPNMLGMVSAILCPLSLARFHYRKRLLGAALVVMSFLLVLFSQSRAGLLGAVIGAGAFYAAYYGRRLWIVLVLVFAAGGMYFVVSELATASEGPGTLLQKFEMEMLRGETDVTKYGSGRIPMWLGAFEKFKKRPFLGYGFGTAGDIYYQGGYGPPARLHSSFVQISAELGVLGMCFFLLPMAYSAVTAARGQLASGMTMRERAVIAGLAAGWFGGAVNSFFESWLFSVGNVASVLAWICFFAAMKGLGQRDLFADGDTNAEALPQE